jgi:hypothetical protein
MVRGVEGAGARKVKHTVENMQPASSCLTSGGYFPVI